MVQSTLSFMRICSILAFTAIFLCLTWFGQEREFDLMCEEGWMKVGGRMEEGWRKVGGRLEEGWRKAGFICSAEN